MCFTYRRKEQECEIAQLKAENDMIRKQALPHRLGPKNIPIPQVPAKIGSLRSSNSTSSQDSTFDDGLGKDNFLVNFKFAYRFNAM